MWGWGKEERVRGCSGRDRGTKGVQDVLAPCGRAREAEIGEVWGLMETGAVGA